MLDINLIRDNPDKVKDQVSKKGVDPKIVDRLLRVDEDWRKKTSALDTLRSDQNKLSDEVKKAGPKPDLISKAQVMKKRISEIEDEKKNIEEKRSKIIEGLPNLPFDDVPVGENESGNVVLKEKGKKPVFKFKPKDYLEIAELRGLIDVKKSADVSGSRFGYLLRETVLLEFALIRLAFDVVLEHGFIPIIPPVMIKEEPYKGMGRLTESEKEERYYMEKDNIYLVGSAEHTIGPFHMNDVLDVKDLPRRYVGFSSCFRREAGSYGKDTKGILRVHQFDKVEMFSFTRPDDSEKEHKLLLSIQEELINKLKLPYRVVEICTGDMGWTDARQYDVDTWMPGQGEYRETHSASNTTDFQARGINARYKNEKGETKHLHMLNATAFAIGRMIIAIIENYQTEKGGVKIPQVLRKYVGKAEIS